MKNHIIKDCSEKMRLDRYLRLLYPSLTQAIIEKLLRNKDIKLNDKRGSSSDRIQNDDIININEKLSILSNNHIHQNIRSSESKILPLGAKILAKKIFTEYLIYEDDDILIINKPSKLATQGGSKVSISLDDALKYLNFEYYKQENHEEISPIKGYRLAHRIDSETSGAIIIAKDKISAGKITAAFKDRLIQKKYLAVTAFQPRVEMEKITSFFAPDVKNKIQKITSRNNPDAKEAITNYKILSKKSVNNHVFFTLELKPETGRMHQLRLHCKEIGSPILNDSKYGFKHDIDNSQNNKNNPSRSNNYLMLHAYEIEIPESVLGKKIVARAEIPEYFKQYMML